MDGFSKFLFCVQLLCATITDYCDNDCNCKYFCNRFTPSITRTANTFRFKSQTDGCHIHTSSNRELLFQILYITYALSIISSTPFVKNQNQVGTALQVFYNLNLLSSTVDEILTTCQTRIEQAIDQTVDQQNLAGNNDMAQKSGEWWCKSQYLKLKANTRWW